MLWQRHPAVNLPLDVILRYFHLSPTVRKYRHNVWLNLSFSSVHCPPNACLSRGLTLCTFPPISLICPLSSKCMSLKRPYTVHLSTFLSHLSTVLQMHVCQGTLHYAPFHFSFSSVHCPPNVCLSRDLTLCTFPHSIILSLHFLWDLRSLPRRMRTLRSCGIRSRLVSYPGTKSKEVSGSILKMPPLKTRKVFSYTSASVQQTKRHHTSHEAKHTQTTSKDKYLNK